MSIGSPTTVETEPASRDVLAGLFGVAVPALATPAALAVFGREDLPNVAILYLFVVAVVSLRGGYRPALLAAVTSAACFDYFFTVPYHSLAITQGRQLVTFAGLFGTAIFISTLNERMRKQARAARQSERGHERQAALVWALAEAGSIEDVGTRAAQQVTLATGTAVRILLCGRDGRGWLGPGADGPSAAAPVDSAAVDWVLSRLEPAGAGTSVSPRSAWTYLPLRTPRGCVGVVAIARRNGAVVRPSSLVVSMTDQIAIAVERTSLAREQQAAQLDADIERMRSAVLSSVSHDLRMPLAVIASASSTLAEQGRRLPAERRAEMSGIIHAEARRLDRLLRSLLDVTRLDSGELHVRRSWRTLEAILNRVRAAVESQAPDRPLVVQLPPDLPPLYVDPTLIEQVLLNVVDNALKHSANVDPIEIAAALGASSVTVSIVDHGSGIAAAELPRIFERFYRGGGAAPGGLGLGLTIAQGIVQAHGGEIRASTTAGKGLTVSFRLPTAGPSVPQPT